LETKACAKSHEKIRLLDTDLDFAYHEEARCAAHFLLMTAASADAKLHHEQILFQKFLFQSRQRLASVGLPLPEGVFSGSSFASINIALVAVWLSTMSEKEKEKFARIKNAFDKEQSERDRAVDMAEAAVLADVVINGVVGFAGLPVTLATLEAGKRLGLANKESLIAAGPVVAKVRHTPGAELVPVDSEHCAVHQCLRANDVPERVAAIVLTASGGPFRGRDRASLAGVTVAEMVPTPPFFMLASRKDSEPTNTSKPDLEKPSRKSFVLFQSPELSFMPATAVGYSFSRRSTSLVVMPTTATGGM
jgi:hypothetical protein